MESCLKMRYEYIMAFFLKESCFKVAVCIYHRMFISRKVVLELQYVYIFKCSSQGKLSKVAVCIYHQVFFPRKVV